MNYKEKRKAITSEKIVSKFLFDKLIPTTKYSICNYYYNDYQMDLVSVNCYDYLIEYEIKTNIKDFKLDKLKIEKHKDINNGKLCNKFFYVIPTCFYSELLFMIEKQYGIITYDKNFDFYKQRDSKIFHKNKVKDKIVFDILKKSYNKFKLTGKELI